MPAKKSTKPKPETTPLPATEDELKSLWSVHGMDDVNFQRGAQVNFWTVMGGLQAAALLTQMGTLWTQMQAGNWHLAVYFVDSILIISLGWSMLSWGSVVLKYQITVYNTLMIFSSNFALAVQCLLVTNPAGWLAATAVAAMFQWMQQVHFSNSNVWVAFSPETVKRLRGSLWVYGLWSLICFAGALHLFLAPSVIAEKVWSVISLAVISDALVRQHRGMQAERKELKIP